MLAISIALTWGINFAVAKSAVSYYPTFFLLFLRLVITVVFLLPFIKKPNIPFIKLFKVSLTLIVLHFSLLYLALSHGLDVSVAVIMDQMRVPFAALLAYLIFKETVSKNAILGMIVAIIGTAIIVGSPKITNNITALCLSLSASTAWAFYNIQVKNMGKIDTISFIGWISIIGMPFLLAASLIFEHNQWQILINSDLKSVISLLYIALFSTLFAHGMWYYLLKLYKINHIIPYSLLVPFFGTLAGVIMLGEHLTWQVIAGGLFTIGGVAIIVTAKPKSAQGGDLS